jgi:plasmid stabilization system protein ParE
MDYRVIFAASADRDLEQIVRFIARKNPAVAERLGHALLDDLPAGRNRTSSTVA